MDWLKSGRKDTFRFQRIKWPGFTYIEDIEHVTDCILTRNTGSSLKVSASMGLSKHIDFGNDMVRIISTSELDGKVAEVVHATLFVSSPSRKLFYEASDGTAKLYSTLTILDKKLVRNTLTIPAGTNAIEWARQTIVSLGLPCTCTPSNARLNTAKTYERDTSYLAVINDLCDFANYGSVTVNGYGGAVLKPYQDPTYLTPTRTINDDSQGILAPEFSIEEDYFDIPNVVALVCSNNNINLSAVATFDDPDSFLSTANRYEVTFTEQVSDIASQTALNAKARARLQDKLSYVERTTVTHPYLPDELGEVWQVNYRAAGYSVRGSIYEQDIKMTPGMQTSTTLRRFVDVG